jgi:kynureninase
LRTDDILRAIEENKNELALIIFGGVQYYTGQFFDIEKITQAGQIAGATVGFDLAHAIGNVPLSLHKHNVEFAVWCGYKYLNSGPGGVAGIFVHEKHSQNFELPRFAGWWGHEQKERFQMKKGFKPTSGAEGWQVSNFPVLAGAAQLASLDVFGKVGMKALRKKSLLLTGYLDFLLRSSEQFEKKFTIITPSDPNERGCQLSILMKENGKRILNKITEAGVISDWREPNVIRVAPVPLYNTFEEVFLFVEIFKRSVAT